MNGRRVLRLAARSLRLSVPLCAFLSLGNGSCGRSPTGPAIPPGDTASTTQTPTLRDLALQRNRRIGAAVDRLFVLPESQGGRYMTTLGRDFNEVTPENDMKHERLQPARGVFRFDRADSIVAYAERNGMRVRGHTLVWHRQLASWLTSGSWTPEEARTLLHDHIATVVSHFRGQLAAWDVVNEAIDDDGSRRTTFWSTNVGPDYVEQAFRWAHDADPDVPLFYNDYNIEGLSPKSDSVLAMLQDLLQRGVPVNGIGFQSHFEAGGLPSRNALVQNFARFAALGLRIHITELDIRVRTPATAADLATQADDYALITDVCLQTPACEMMVLWGFTDRDSWIPGTFPGWGQALLYDENYAPKSSYWAVYNHLRS